MKPKILFVIEPDEVGDYVQARVSVSGTTDDGDNHWVRMYEEGHIAQELPDTMAVEQWLLAAIAEHTDAIKAALATRINRGQRTLMLDTYVVKTDLRVAPDRLTAGRQ